MIGRRSGARLWAAAAWQRAAHSGLIDDAANRASMLRVTDPQSGARLYEPQQPIRREKLRIVPDAAIGLACCGSQTRGPLRRSANNRQQTPRQV
jgi:hypothetical protein